MLIFQFVFFHAPEIDLSAEFITAIWRNNDATNDATDNPNVATNLGTNIGTNDATYKTHNPLTNSTSRETNVGTNIATSDNNIATDYLAENKRIIDEIVSVKIKPWMRKEQIQDCIIEACIVEHSLEELAVLLHKTTQYLRNFIIPELVADGTLLRTKPSHSPGQTYMTNPKLDKYKCYNCVNRVFCFVILGLQNIFKLFLCFCFSFQFLCIVLCF